MKLAEILKTHRKQIVDEWIYRLHTEVSDRYRGRPVDELFHTVSRASEANYEVLIHNDFSKVNDHIHWIKRPSYNLRTHISKKYLSRFMKGVYNNCN